MLKARVMDNIQQIIDVHLLKEDKQSQIDNISVYEDEPKENYEDISDCSFIKQEEANKILDFIGHQNIGTEQIDGMDSECQSLYNKIGHKIFKDSDLKEKLLHIIDDFMKGTIDQNINQYGDFPEKIFSLMKGGSTVNPEQILNNEKLATMYDWIQNKQLNEHFEEYLTMTNSILSEEEKNSQ